MKRTRKRILVGGMAAVVASSVIGIGAAQAAQVPCGPRTVSKAFAQFGDSNDYFVVSDGTFETGASSWKLTTAAALSIQQSPWRVNGATHARSLAIGTGGTAQAPSTCVGAGEDYVRFFYRSSSYSTSTGPAVTITSTSPKGTVTKTVQATSSVPSLLGWYVSDPIAIPDVRGENFEQDVTITFSAAGRMGFLIDDVMIDPFKPR